MSWRENAKVRYENLAFGENTLALRLENVSLREPLSDLRAGYANPIVRSAHGTPEYTGISPLARICTLFAWRMPRPTVPQAHCRRARKP